MGQPAARVGDLVTCPIAAGPILPAGAPAVLIGGQPAARVGDTSTCLSAPDVLIKGEPTVLIAGSHAARLGDCTAHGGVVSMGFATVEIGLCTQCACMKAAAASGVAFVEISG